MKVLLIQPVKPKFDIQAADDWTLTRPFSLFFLASAIENNTDYEVEILDFEREDHQRTGLRSAVERSDPDVFGITATTFTRFDAIDVIRELRKMRPTAPIVVGGVHFMYCAEDTLREVPEVDVVVHGEGDVTIVKLLEAIDKGTGLADTKGISYRGDDGHMITNQPQPLVPNLDEIPAYKKYAYEEYPEYLFNHPGRVPAVSVMSSRGCPFKCVFCSKAGMKYRVRDAERTVDEIEDLMARFDVSAFNFLDLTFTANRKHVRAVCNELIKRELNIQWWCESRVNIHLDLLDLMREAGCTSIAIGVESGSQRMLDTMSKGITVEQVVAFTDKCKELGIVLQPYFMYSHRGEEYDDCLKTLELISVLEESTELCSFQPAMIFPGTELERIAREEGKLPADFSWSKPYYSELNKQLDQLINTPLYIDKLSAEQMIELHRRKKMSAFAHTILKESPWSLVRKVCKSLANGRFYSDYLFSTGFYAHLMASAMRRLKPDRGAGARVAR
jgi:radical SAM superfamily enzyme YgiQ (UPF0313 family)|tara:strand:+ start:4676 stop:6181 length:1506 start_codon:yes stop_codon:yes gene_type:complete